MRKAHDLRELPLEDLENMERERAEELMNERIRVKMRQTDNPLKIRTLRRDLAVLKTVINQKKKAARS
jgi:large subunit ribosomal protein L29